MATSNSNISIAQTSTKSKIVANKRQKFDPFSRTRGDDKASSKSSSYSLSS